MRSFSVSPDEQTIAFERAATLNGADSDIWLMNRDGSGMQLLVEDGRAPNWGDAPVQAVTPTNTSASVTPTSTATPDAPTATPTQLPSTTAKPQSTPQATRTPDSAVDFGAYLPLIRR